MIQKVEYDTQLSNVTSVVQLIEMKRYSRS